MNKFAKPMRGFTLIELMTVIAIISILAAIAIPQYNRYVIKSKLIEAPATLSDFRVKMEQYYQDNRNYGTAGASPCGVANPVGKFFTYSCTVGATDQTYTVTATNAATGGLGAAGSYVYTLNESNVQQTTNLAGVASTLNCWATTPGQTTC